MILKDHALGKCQFVWKWDRGLLLLRKLPDRTPKHDYRYKILHIYVGVVVQSSTTPRYLLALICVRPMYDSRLCTYLTVQL